MSRSRLSWFFIALGLLFLITAVYSVRTYRLIRQSAVIDEARMADAIIVLGAAQYNGEPSPVLRARLDHTLGLFEQGFSNVIITTGSFGPDPNFSEAHVSTRYLSGRGVDPSQIITEQGGDSTYDTVQAVSRLMHSNGWTRAIVVSDGFHLYRLKHIFRDNQIEVFASPASESPIEKNPGQSVWFSVREVLLLTAYRLGRVFRLA